MSKTIDQKVVEMQFNNKDFEKNVSKSLTTLDKLKKALKMDGAVKSFEDIQRKADSLRFNGLANTVDNIADKFSGLQMVGTMAMIKLAQRAADLGLSMAKSLTLDPIKTGFNEYELKMGSVQTIMAGTGESLKTVNKYLEELNRYSDQTIYSFSDMTSNIGKFTNAGVKLEDAVLAIKGVSNEAALSGANAQEASRAMYNFAQSLSSGYVKLIDWKSIENANMATKEFKEQLIQSAVAAGTLKKAQNGMYKTKKGTLISATKNFNDSLQEQWMTSGVLIKTLKNYADSTTDIGKRASAAATEVKTFTMLWDTLKEAAQSGWAQTWELIIGDFEEAKKMLTGISNVVGGIIDASAKSRNDLLKGWKDLGGRDAMLEGFKNIAKAIGSIVKPIKEAFREIFPPTTAKQLFSLTKSFKEFTSHLILGEKTSKALKNSFKGVFAILKTGINIVVTIAKAAFNLVSIFLPLGKGIVYVTGALGNWINKTTESIRKSDKLAQILKTVTDAIKKFVDESSKFIKQIFKFDSVLNFFRGLFTLIKNVGLAIGKFIGGIIHNGDLNQVMKLVNSGLISVAIIKLQGVFKSFKEAFKSFKGVADNAAGILNNIKGILEAYQKDIQAKTLLKIAGAVAILVGSIWLLSSIDSVKLAKGIGAMAMVMAELMVCFKVLTKLSENKKILLRNSLALINLSLSLLILGAAIKTIGSLKFGQMITGLIGLAGAMGVMVAAIKLLPDDGETKKKTKGLITLSLSLLIMSVALKKIGSMSLMSIIKGLTTMLIALASMASILSKMNSESALRKSIAMLVLANSLILLSGALKILGSMSWGEISRGLTAMAGSLTILTVVMKLLPNKGNIFKSVGLFGTIASMIILAGALKILATMNWSAIARSLTAMGGALTILVVAMKILGNNIGGSLAGAGALLIASAALIELAIGLKILASIKPDKMVKALLGLAAALTILGIAGALLSKVAGGLLMVAGAAALFGVAAIALGVGLGLIAAGISALALALSAGTTAIVAGLSAIILGIVGLIPEIVKALGLAIAEFCKVIIECAPLIAKAIGTVLLEAVKMLKDFVPPIVTALLDLIIQTIRAITNRVPELIMSIAELLSAIFKGFMDALQLLDSKTLLGGIACIGMLVVIFDLLASLAITAPAAAIGVVAFGALLVELMAIMTLVGKLKGLVAGIKDAGEVLQAVGTAIGRFIGGIIGGFGLGVSDAMPTIATNLSQFMTNLQPFIKGISTVKPDTAIRMGSLAAGILVLTAANFIAGLGNLLSLGNSLPKLGKDLSLFMTNAKPFIDSAIIISPNMMQGVQALANAIMVLTGANVLKSMSKLFTWFTGDNSFEKFGKEIASLGTGMKNFAKNLGTFSDSQVTSISAACEAISALAKAAKQIPNEGGLWAGLVGDNSIGKWSAYLPPLGKNLNEFVKNLGTFSDSQVGTVTAAGNAIKGLAEASKQIPNEGGLWSWIAGDNSVGKFSDHLPEVGKNLADMASQLQSFTEEQVGCIKNAGLAIAALAEAANKIPNTGGMVSWFTGDNDISQFADKLPGVATNLKNFSKNLGTYSETSSAYAGFAGDAIAALAKAANKIPNTGGIVSWFKGDSDISQFADKLPNVGTMLKNFITNLGTFTEAQVSATDCAGQAIARLAEAASKVPNAGGLHTWFTGESDISQFAGKWPGVAIKLGEFVKNLGTFNEDQVATTNCAANAILKLAEAAKKVPAVGGLVSWFTGESDLSAFAGKFPGVGIHLKNFVTNLGTFTEDQVTTVNCAGKAISTLAKAANEVPNTGGLKQWFTGEKDISAFSDKLPGVGNGIKGLANKLGTFSQTQVESVKAGVDALKYVVYFNNDVKDVDDLEDRSDKLVNVADGIKNFIEGLAKISSENAENAKKNAKEFYSLTTQLASMNFDSMKTLGDSMKNIGDNTIDKFVSAFNGDSPKEKIAKALRDLVTKMIDTMETKRTDVENKMASLINSALNKINESSMIDKMKTAGKNFAQGFANGIENNRYLAVDAGTHLGNDAYNAAKRAIDAHSPSKKAHKLGNFFGLGFVNGIHEYTSNAYSESYSMADEARKGLSNAISKVNDILNDDRTNQPTIRPILDLTDIESGAGRINGLFKSINVGGNLNAISVGMKSRGQNGTANDVVSAINKLGSNLGSGGDTYNINGITYDDQSSVADAIQTLIRAANVERRS